MVHLDIPEVNQAANGTKWTGLEGICLLLRRLNYPNRLDDLVPEFGRHISDIGIIFNEMVYFIDQRWGHLLQTFEQNWLHEDNLRIYANSIYEAGCPLKNCFGFIDGTLVQTCRPKYNQRELYNGKSRIHGLKYQAIVLPNGMICNLFGPMEGRRHDATLLRESQVLDKINGRAEDGSTLVLYGDKAYPLNDKLITPYRAVNCNEEERQFNEAMNKGRIAVEWAFAKISSNFAFTKFAPNQKVYLQPIALYYKVAVLLSNCHSCCYGNQTCDYFGIMPPTLEDYLGQ